MTWPFEVASLNPPLSVTEIFFSLLFTFSSSCFSFSHPTSQVRIVIDSRTFRTISFFPDWLSFKHNFFFTRIFLTQINFSVLKQRHTFFPRFFLVSWESFFSFDDDFKSEIAIFFFVITSNCNPILFQNCSHFLKNRFF